MACFIKTFLYFIMEGFTFAFLVIQSVNKKNAAGFYWPAADSHVNE
jgi:hypothetical protein